MSMLLIEGVYRIVGASPDGDSVRFYPADPSQWDLLRGRRVRRNQAGGAQLRLDGIDTLETHYRPPHGPELHQPAPYAAKAAEELLDRLGFSDVERDSRGIVKRATPESRPGYIFTRSADVHGRCVAFAGVGAAPGPSGTFVRFEVSDLLDTLNHHQLAEGLAYPTFYRQLFVDLREAMATAAQEARAADKGLWQSDQTQSGAKITGLDSLTTSAVLLPKLFRRLADYLVLGDGNPSLDGFHAYLAQRDDRLLIVSNGQWTGFDTVVDVAADAVKLTHPPEDLVFDEK
ncbi:thermonuclease family protein [Streptomyces sp. NPDC047081]|uniref:thermonuclease family protein n=1 Tax=Streptomyces sp. NPDC047081 TaxID=3154706 RepID=UPI003403966D